MNYYPSLSNKNENRVTADRFIPLRESSKNGYVLPPSSPPMQHKNNDAIESLLPAKQKQLRFSKCQENLDFLVEEKAADDFPRRNVTIAKQPFKVLEAPSLLDDFYLNLVAWSQTNIIAVGLEDSVYFFNFLNNSVARNFSIPKPVDSTTFGSDDDLGPYVCSLAFNELGNTLAVTDSRGQIFLNDVEQGKVLSQTNAHSSRVGSLHWQENLLISGSRDKTVRLFDVRDKLCRPQFTFSGHFQEICGLKLSPDGMQIASGGNDNQLLLWDVRKMSLLNSLGEHEAAVKALAWNPHKRSILASGAGTNDRKLRIFDTARGEQLAKVDTGSQICNLAFDKDGESLISTHGYSLNQMILWQPSKDFDRLRKEEVLIAHKLRVLYLALSPCGKYVATGAGDETVRIWNMVNQRRGFAAHQDDSMFGKNIMRMR